MLCGKGLTQALRYALKYEHDITVALAALERAIARADAESPVKASQVFGIYWDLHRKDGWIAHRMGVSLGEMPETTPPVQAMLQRAREAFGHGLYDTSRAWAEAACVQAKADGNAPYRKLRDVLVGSRARSG